MKSSLLLWVQILILLICGHFLLGESSKRKLSTGGSVYNSRIAVCVSGQVSRFQPHFLIDNLVGANPKYEFVLFYNLQRNNGSKNAVHSTGAEFHPTAMVDFNETGMVQHIEQLLQNASNADIGAIQYYHPQTLEYWVAAVNGPLDRMKQHNMHHGSPIALNIMNMYHAQVKCAEQIVEFEEARQRRYSLTTPWQFDYVISTREDVYFYTPMPLEPLMTYMRRDPTTPGAPDHNCDVVFKECLRFFGFNMRLQLWNRAAGVNVLSHRFSFYRDMHTAGLKVSNPESFEAMQAGMYDLVACPVPITKMPVTAARHVQHGEICFYDFESTKDCVPPSVYAQVQKVPRCEDLEKKLLAPAPQ